MATPTPETALARRWLFDVNMGTDEAPDWKPLIGLTNWVPKVADQVLQDDSDYDGGGWGSSVKTGLNWSGETTFLRKASSDSTIYAPVHEKIRTAAFSFESASKIGIRFYDRNGLPEAYQGTALPGWEVSGGDRTALESVKSTMTGVGPLVMIDNPLAA